MWLLQAFAVWLAIIAAESLHGVVRRLVWGDALIVRQIGTMTGALIVLGIALLTIRRINPRSVRDALAIGAVWVFLTIAFDITLGRLTGASWERIGSDFDLTHGGLLPLGLAVMLFAPLIAKTMRGA